jgi:hypothetical protein
MKFENGGFSKMCKENFNFHQNLARIMGTLREDLRSFVIITG